MANKEVKVSIVIDDNGSMRLTEESAKKLGVGLDKVGKGARTTDRNLKGAAKTSSNTTKNFSKMAQGITGGLVPAYATLAANVFAISAAFNFFKKAADIRLLEESQVSFAANTGQALSRVTDGLREASQGMLDFQKASEAAAIGIAKGFSPSQLNQLAEGAQKASNALGRNFEDSFDRLIRGVSKAEPELLDELGITLRLAKATQTYADSINKNVKALTAAERSQAVLVETQRQLNDLFGDAEANANPFVKLGVVFNDLVKDITQSLLPAFEGIANLISRSPKAAIIIFGALGLSIAKAALPLEAMGESFTAWQQKHRSALDEAKGNIQKYEMALNDAAAAQKKLTDQANASLQKRAAQFKAPEDGKGRGKILAQLKDGKALDAAQKGALTRALKGAEAQYAKHNEIKTGIFRGADIAIVRSFQAAMVQIDVSAKTTSFKTLTYFERMVLQAKLRFAQLGAVGATAMKGIAAAASFAGKVINKAFAFAAIIGILVLLIETFKTLKVNILDIARSVAKGFDATISFLANGVRLAINGVIEFIAFVVKGYNELIKLVTGGFAPFDNLIEGIRDLKNLKPIVITVAADGLEGSDLEKYLTAVQAAARAEQKRTDALESLKRETESYVTAIGEVNKVLETGTALQKANALITVNASGVIREAIKAQEAGVKDLSKQYEDLQPQLLKLGKIYPALITAINDFDPRTGDWEEFLKTVESYENRAGSAVANNQAFNDTLEQTALSLSKITGAKDAVNLSIQIGLLQKAQADAELGMVGINGELVDFKTKLANAFAPGTDLNALKATIDQIDTAMKANIASTNKLAIARTKESRLVSIASKRYKEANAITAATLKLDKLSLDLQLARELATTALTKAQERANNDAILGLQQQVDLQKAVVEETKLAADEFKAFGLILGDVLVNQLSSVVQAVLQGTKSFKEGLKDFTVGILKTVADYFTKIAAFQLLKKILPKSLQVTLGFDIAGQTKEAAALVGKAVLDATNKAATTVGAAVADPVSDATKALNLATTALQKAVQNGAIELGKGITAALNQGAMTLSKAMLEACRACEPGKGTVAVAAPAATLPVAPVAAPNAVVSAASNADFSYENSITKDIVDSSVILTQVKDSTIAAGTAIGESAAAIVLTAEKVPQAVDNAITTITDGWNSLWSGVKDSLNKQAAIQVENQVMALGGKNQMDRARDEALRQGMSDNTAASGANMEVPVKKETIFPNLDEIFGRPAILEETAKEQKVALVESALEQKTIIEEGVAAIVEVIATIPAALNPQTSLDMMSPDSNNLLANGGTPDSLGFMGAANIGDPLSTPANQALPGLGGGPMEGIDATGDGEEKKDKGLIDAFKNLDTATLASTAAVTGLLAGVLGNTKAGQFLAQVTQALQLATILQTLWDKIFGVKQTIETNLNTAALTLNTAALVASSVVPLRTGGVVSAGAKVSGYAAGGIAGGSTSGYPAMLHGTEAVVPLPNGRSIPVDMGKGAGQTNNNVNVSVSVANDGSTNASADSDSKQGADLGKRISVAIQAELQSQKRPGGILSPFGAG